MIQRKKEILSLFLLLQNVSSLTAVTSNIRGHRKLGDRVSALDKSDAICEAGVPDDQNAPVGVTHIKYYYAVESDETIGVQTLWELERNLFYSIGNAVLWCSQSDGAVAQSTGGGRMLSDALPRYLDFSENRRNLSIEDARRLGILSFNSAPSDVILTAETCAHETSNDECIIAEGRMALMAHQTDNLDIIVSSILDGVQQAMDDDVLIPSKPCSTPMCAVNKVKWLGTTIEEARAGGPVESSEVIEEEENDDDIATNLPMIAYAAIPVALLLGLAFLLNNKKRRELTPAQLALEQDYVLVGTGDPPRHFHEGMYHYTRSGARYLSTNCKDCYETRRLGFSTDADLPTIAEGRLYDPTNLGASGSSDGDLTEVSSYDASTYRKLHHVPALSGNLAGKHSSIDVHQCTSQTCRICSYRPKDATFIPAPRVAMSPTNGVV